MSQSSWKLDSGEARAAAAPRSFFIPSLADRRKARLGGFVKLIFRGGDTGESRTERMWVEVTEIQPNGRFVGHLDNDPQTIPGLTYRDVVEFGPENIVAIQFADGELGYSPNDWAYVDSRVRTIDQAPELLIRAAVEEGGDSAWFATITHDRPEETMTLGDLTDRWPSLALVFRSGEGVWEQLPGTNEWCRMPNSK